jgi:branched-chain amino acid aminotransferase
VHMMNLRDHANMFYQLPYTELPEFTEVFAAGTAAALVPIKSITRLSTNDKFLYQSHEGGATKPGPAFVKLLSTLKGIQLGKIEDKSGWLQKVAEPDQSLYTVRQEGKANGAAK